MMVKMLMPPSFHCNLVSCGFHHAFTLVGVIRPAHWTLGKLSVERLEDERYQPRRVRPPGTEPVHSTSRSLGLPRRAIPVEREQNQSPDNPHVRSRHGCPGFHPWTRSPAAPPITDRSDLRSTTAGRAASLGSCEGYDSMRTTGLLVSRGISPVLEGRGTCPSPHRLGQHLLRAPLRPRQILHGRRGTRRKRPTS